jgi:hypothetical protein
VTSIALNYMLRAHLVLAAADACILEIKPQMKKKKKKRGYKVWSSGYAATDTS